MIVLLDRPFPETSLAQSAELDLRNIGPKVWPQVLAHCRAQKLRLYHLTLASLEPLVELPGLTELSLSNVRIDDDDIRVLARCTGLRRLKLSNPFERAQVAFIASRLNAQLAQPLTACVETRVPCKKCAAPTSMFSGRRMPFLCPDCDRKRFEKLTGEFDQLVREAQG